MAESGKELLSLVAKHTRAWVASPIRPLFASAPVTSVAALALAGPSGGIDGDIPFGDRESFLIHANSYAAVVGIDDAQISRNAQPSDTPYMPSIPQIGGGVAAMPTNGAGSGDALNRLRQMMAAGSMPSREQLQSLLPAMQ
jgi:hypothetical protein